MFLGSHLLICGFELTRLVFLSSKKLRAHPGTYILRYSCQLLIATAILVSTTCCHETATNLSLFAQIGLLSARLEVFLSACSCSYNRTLLGSKIVFNFRVLVTIEAPEIGPAGLFSYRHSFICRLARTVFGAHHLPKINCRHSMGESTPKFLLLSNFSATLLLTLYLLVWSSFECRLAPCMNALVSACAFL